MWQNGSICLYLVCKIWHQCILANYIALYSVERIDVTVCMWFSWVVKLCITCIAGWAKIRIVLGMEPRVPLSSLTPVPITAVTNPLSLYLSHKHTVMRDEWMKAEEERKQMNDTWSIPLIRRMDAWMDRWMSRWMCTQAHVLV